jgi:hypothetical protein
VFDSPADFLTEWHRIVAERDLEALREVLIEDVSIGAPPYWNRIEGRDVVHHLLGLVVSTIEGFSYHREWVEGRELALEFTGSVADRELQGIDLISLDGDHRLCRIDVLMRPVGSVVALREAIAPQMAEYLSRAAS